MVPVQVSLPSPAKISPSPGFGDSFSNASLLLLYVMCKSAIA